MNTPCGLCGPRIADTLHNFDPETDVREFLVIYTQPYKYRNENKQYDDPTGEKNLIALKRTISTFNENSDNKKLQWRS